MFSFFFGLIVFFFFIQFSRIPERNTNEYGRGVGFAVATEA